MNILNMYVLQCILYASERKLFRIYDLQYNKIIIIIMDFILNLIWSTHSYEDHLEYCPAPLECLVLHILRLPCILLKCP